MSRSVVYLANQSSTYMQMVSVSVQTLRKYNKDIAIHCFHVLDQATQTISRGQAVKFDIEGDTQIERDSAMFKMIMEEGEGVHYHPIEPFRPEGDEDFFHINRVVFNEVPEDSMLYIDGDTFIFGDISEIFDAYQDVDYAGYEARWVHSRDWNPQFFEGRTPFGSGVMLWNNHSVRDWAQNLPSYSKFFRERGCELGDWLYKLHSNCLLREEFSVSQHLYSNNMNVGVMKRNHCITMHNDNDWNEFGKSTIFHTYATGWKQGINRLYGSVKKVRPRRPKRIV